MSVRRLYAEQPADFAFTQDNLQWAEQQIAKYPAGRQASAVIPLLWKAQEQHHGWLPEPAIRRVAEMLGMPVIRVMEVATFYTMFNLSPVGEHFVQLCGTTPCALRGASALKDVCRKIIGDERQVSSDGKLSWLEVECLGACANAPMVQINFDYYEDLDPENFEKLLGDLRSGRAVSPGSQTGRSCSAPLGGDTTLTDEALYDGSRVGAWKKRFEEESGPGDATEANQAGRPAEQSRPEARTAPAQPGPEAKSEATKSGDDRLSDRSRREGNGFPYSSPPAATAAQPAVSADKRPIPTGPGVGFAGIPPLEPERKVAGAKSAAGAPLVTDAHKPALLAAPRDGKGDDLKDIWGVGPKLEKLLHSLGVFHFDQVAAWSDDELGWIDAHLDRFKGRAIREMWSLQGKVLRDGGTEQDAENAVRKARGEIV